MTRVAIKNFKTSLSFTGAASSGSKVVVPDAAQIKFASSFSVSWWIKSSITPSNTNPRVFSKFPNYYAYKRSAASQDCYCRSYDGTNTLDIYIPNVFINEWVHCVYVVNTITSEAYGYRNGVLVATDAFGAFNPALMTSTQTLNIGCPEYSDFSLLGRVDEFRTFNKALTATEISQMYYNNIVPSGLTSEYLFNEGTGTTAADSSGYANNGTITGATYSTNVPIVPRNEAKGANYSLYADNTNGLDNQWAELPTASSPLIPQHSSCTVSCWVKPIRLATSGAGWLIVKPYGSASGGRAGSIVLNTTGTISFVMVNNAGTNFDLPTPASVTWSRGVWTHVIGTYEASTGLMTLYINGQIVATLAATANSTTTGTNKMYFFSERDTGTPRTLPAQLNQVRIWSRAITADEAQYLYSRGTDLPEAMKTNLLGEWLFNEGQNSTAVVDTSGRGKNMTIQGSLTYLTDSTSKPRLMNRDMKSSLSFAGAGYAQLPAIPTTTGLSITAWIKMNNTVPSATNEIIGRNGGSSDAFEILNTGQIRFAAVTSGGTCAVTSGTNPFARNTWTHVAGTYNITTGVGNIYVNGVIVGTATAGSGTFTNNASTWMLGALTTVTRNFTGNIVDVRVFDGELTSAQVLNIYQGNSEITTGPTLVAKYALDQGAGNPIDTSGKEYNATSLSGATYVLDVPFYKRQDVNPNLIQNGDFEYAPPFTAATTTDARFVDGTSGGSTTNSLFRWATNLGGSNRNVQFDTSISKFGGASIKCSTTGTASNAFASPVRAPGTASIVKQFAIPALPSTSYTLSFWMKTNYTSGDSNDGAHMRLEEFTGDGATITSTDSTKLKITSDWTQYTVVVTTSATTRFLVPIACVRGNTGTATLIMDAWFDDIILKPTTATTRLTA